MRTKAYSNRTVHQGVLRSRDLKELAKPLAVLLAILFSLTVHINAALAAGGDTSICAASRVFNNVDSVDTELATQLEHCGLCLLSGQYKAFGLADESGPNFSSLKTGFVPGGQPSAIDESGTEHHRIRAPPLS